MAFGAREWEEHGLWQSFAQGTDFSLWEYRPPYVDPAPRDAAYRARLARAFLDRVDAVEKERDLHCVFFYASAEHIDLTLLDELHRRGIWTVVMGLDDKHQFVRPRDPANGEAMQLTLATRCDLYWTTWRTGAHIVAAAGGRPWYAPEGAHPSFHRPLGLERELDVLFIGQAYGARGELVAYLRRRGFSITTYGAGWPGGFVPFDQSVELFNRARIVLGVGGSGHTTEVKHLKGRDFEVPMCGALYLTSFNPELVDHFRIGEEILCYSSPQDCAEVLHWILRQPERAQRLRDAALARSRAEHTWVHRIEMMCRLLTGQAVSREAAEQT